MQNGGLRPATIEDVAREAGVSRAAVSKVLRDAYGVSPAMRERVSTTIERLGYRPRVAARSMRGASFTLGFEVPDIANPFFAKMLAGASNALRSTNYQLIIAPADAGSDEGYRPLQTLADHQVDGIVAVSPLADPEWLEDLAERVAVVMLGRHDSSRNYDTLVGDDVAGTRAVMDHLFGLGHSRILHLTRDEHVTAEGSGTPHSVRLRTYRECMAGAGHEARIRVARTGAREEEAAETVRAILGEPEPPTAIFAGNDDLAVGAQQAVAESAADISIVGYDDVAIAGHPLISLTTVAQSGEWMGERVVGMLLERIAGRREPLHEIVMPELRVRNSTRPPAAVQP